jgi:SAM-dependent methyltransferase
MNSEAPITYDLSLLQKSRQKWQASPELRAVYADIFADLRRWLAPGRTLEIGSGIGVSRDYIPGLVTSDVVATPFVDRAVSAYAIPSEGWGNLIAFDVLHHLQEPLRFFASAAAALAPGGRVVLAEPAGTPGGRLFYRFFHHEPCRPGLVRPPFVFPAEADGSFANMGMGHALFSRHRPVVAARLRELGLTMVAVQYRDLLAYPATGGFSRPALLPEAVLRGLMGIERRLPQALLRLLALRMVIVIERATDGRSAAA